MKTCRNPDCTEINPQPLECFDIRTSSEDGHNHRCKSCRRYYMNKLNSKPESKIKRDEYYAREDVIKRSKNYRLLKHYGLTLEQYNAMLSSQNNMCFICQVPSPRPLAVDHNHITGKVRGLLCDNCNRALGLLKVDNNDTIADRIKEYLKHS